MIWVRISFLGKQDKYVVKKLIRKIQRNLSRLNLSSFIKPRRSRNYKLVVGNGRLLTVVGN